MRGISRLVLMVVPALLVVAVMHDFFEQTAASAGPYFVSPAGSGSACTQALPCRIQTALSAVAQTGDSVYVAAGIYTGGSPALLTITKSIRLLGGWNGAPAGSIVRDPAVYVSVLDGQSARRVVHISGNITPTVEGLVIANGNASGQSAGCLASSATGCGGGIFVLNAHPVIANNVITHNAAVVTGPQYFIGHGGGVYLEAASNAVISSNLIISNTAAWVWSGEGGGIAVHGYSPGLVIQHNRIVSNVAEAHGDSSTWGGGVSVHSAATPLVQDNRIEGNWAHAGAGFYAWTADPTFARNQVQDNRGDSAVYFGYANALVQSNWIVSNATVSGIELFNNYPGEAVLLVNNVVARSGADAIFASGHLTYALNMRSLHNTLVGNGGGNAVNMNTVGITASLTNTIMSNFAVGLYNSSPTTTAVMRTTLLDNVTTAVINATQFGTISGNPRFANTVGGDYHIGATSAARDAGIATGVARDIDGQIRPIGAVVDIGADEWAPPLFLPLIAR